MIIIIDNKTRLNVDGNYIAVMKVHKRANQPDQWEEYKWFTRIESAIDYLSQKRLSESERVVDMATFLSEYKIVRDDIKRLVTLPK